MWKERVLAHLQTECSNEVEFVSPAKTKVDANASSTERDFGGFDTLGCLLMMNGANVVQAYAVLLLLLIDFPC